MSDWKPKRFWKTAQVIETDGGYTVQLDARPVKTPAKAALVVPTAAMAQAIAQEWDAQTELIDPRTMPVTRSANAAIDKVLPQRAEVVDLLAEYGDTDLLCYRADSPEGLVLQQAEGWDPMLEWAATTLGARLRPATGVMHIAQDESALAALRAELDQLDHFALAGAHDLISLSGSLVLALAVMHNALSAQHALNLSRIDEVWQIAQWGEDAEAAATSDIKREAFLHAESFHRLSRPGKATAFIANR